MSIILESSISINYSFLNSWTSKKNVLIEIADDDYPLVVSGGWGLAGTWSRLESLSVSSSDRLHQTHGAWPGSTNNYQPVSRAGFFIIL